MEIKGILNYLTWDEPWKVGGVDIRESVMDVFDNIRGHTAQMADHNDRLNHFRIFKSTSADHVVLMDDKYPHYIWLSHPTKFSGQNIQSYLEESLVWFNGREVCFSWDDEAFKIYVLDEGKTPCVHFSKETRGNSIPLRDDSAESICKRGQGERCCIFLTIGSTGWECQKFNGPMARTLLDRLSKGTINAKRVGNCQIVVPPWVKKEVS